MIRILEYLSKGNIQVVVLVMFLVFFAMIIDLISGIIKAKNRKELIQSQVLKRTITKFIVYEGSLIIASMVDVLIQVSNVLDFTKLTSFISVPIVTIFLGIFLLVVEFLSVREKADDKTRRRQEKTAREIIKLINSNELQILTKALKEKEDEQ